jgi:hypothetical protein
VYLLTAKIKTKGNTSSMKLLKRLLLVAGFVSLGAVTTSAQIDSNLTTTYPVFKLGNDLDNAAMLEASAVMAETLGDFELAEIYRSLAISILAAAQLTGGAPDLPVPAPPRNCLKEYGDGMTGCFATYANCLIDGGMPPFTCAASNRPTVNPDTMCRWFRDHCMAAARDRFDDCRELN